MYLSYFIVPMQETKELIFMPHPMAVELFTQ